jgi:hypothetical protein
MAQLAQVDFWPFGNQARPVRDWAHHEGLYRLVLDLATTRPEIPGIHGDRAAASSRVRTCLSRR